MSSVRKKFLKVFFYLFYKCCLVRRKHTKLILFQLLIPAISLIFWQRFSLEYSGRFAKETIFNSEYVGDILNRMNHNITLFYFPTNNVTNEIMSKFKICSHVRDNRKFGIKIHLFFFFFHNISIKLVVFRCSYIVVEIHRFETAETALTRMKNNSNAVMIEFENSSSEVLKYKLRTKLEKQLKLYMKHDNKLDKRTLFVKEAFVQIQHCLDFSFIEYIARKPIPPLNVNKKFYI